MTPRQLTYFLRIAELGSFTRAAAVLFIAQPALSRQVKQLEDELGVALFVRSDNGIRLTDAGSLLVDRARGLLQQLESVRIEVGALASTVQGRLQFGVPPSLFDLITVPATTLFRRQYPAVHLSITEGISTNIYQMVLSGELDAGIVSSTESMTGLSHQALVTEPLVLAYPSDMTVPLCDDGSVRIAEVARLPLALTCSPNAMRVVLDEAIQGAGHKVTLLLESNSTRLLLKAVANGLGCTVNPYSAVHTELGDGSIRIAPVQQLSVTWTLIYARERHLSMAAQKLVELIAKIATDKIATHMWPGAAAV